MREAEQIHHTVNLKRRRLFLYRCIQEAVTAQQRRGFMLNTDGPGSPRVLERLPQPLTAAHAGVSHHLTSLLNAAHFLRTFVIACPLSFSHLCFRQSLAAIRPPFLARSPDSIHSLAPLDNSDKENFTMSDNNLDRTIEAVGYLMI